MKVRYRFRNCASSGGMKAYVEEKLEKLTRLLEDDFVVDIVASVQKHHTHRIEIDVSAGAHGYSGHCESHDMYASFDEALDKIQTQIRREKAAVTRSRRCGGSLTEKLVH